MPRGGPRLGSGGARPGAGRPRKIPPVANPAPRPVFATGKDFALWALNAPDAEVPMDAKMRVALSLLQHEPMPAKPPAPADPPHAYRPRAVRPFRVIEGDE